MFDLGQIFLAVWTLVALIILFWAIQQGLLGTPEMQITGNGSTASQLHWYTDRAGETLRDQTAFATYLTRRAADPTYTFRHHLRRVGGAVEE